MIKKPEGLALLRAPFEANQISKLPKGTKAQNTCQNSEKINCTVCGGWHHPKIRHLDYVGHAAVTDRLLDCDEAWSWEPLAFGPDGLPALDAEGGLWIRLTVCGVSRLGYGNAISKPPEISSPGDRIKEVIGDAVRNAAMRFGAALELWHKGELHAASSEDYQSDELGAGAGKDDGALAAFEEQHLPAMREAATLGSKALAEAFAALPKGPATRGFWTEHQARLKAVAADADKASAQ